LDGATVFEAATAGFVVVAMAIAAKVLALRARALLDGDLL
jgi:hypothetical protein